MDRTLSVLPELDSLLGNTKHALRTKLLPKPSSDTDVEVVRVRILDSPALKALCSALSRHYKHPKYEAYFSRIPSAAPNTVQKVFTWWLTSVRTDYEGVFNGDEDRDGELIYEESPGVVLAPPQQFNDWLKHNRNPVCWIQGDPISGKTVLMKHVVTEMNKIPSPGTPVVIHHFIDQDEYASQRSYGGMVRNILLQLFRHFPFLVGRAFLGADCTLAANNSATILTVLECALERSMQYLLNGDLSLSQSVYIFLDGPSGFEVADGCGGQQFARFVQQIVDLHATRKVQRSSPIVKLCVATRPEGVFHDWHYVHDWYRRGSRVLVYKFPTLNLQKWIDTPVDYLGKMSDKQQKDLCASMLSQVTANSKDGHHSQLLSTYLNLIVAHNQYQFHTARKMRPLSLLQLALCLCPIIDGFYGPEFADYNPNKHPPASLDSCYQGLEDFEDRSLLSSLIKCCQQLVKRVSKQFYPLIVFCKMTGPWGELDYDLPVNTSPLERASRMQVTFVHESIGKLVTGTHEGGSILKGDSELIKEHRAKLLLRSSLCEYIVLTRGYMWDKARKVRGRTTTGYRAYEEHVKFAENLAKTVPNLAGLKEEELFSESWVREYKPKDVSLEE